GAHVHALRRGLRPGDRGHAPPPAVDREGHRRHRLAADSVARHDPGRRDRAHPARAGARERARITVGPAGTAGTPGARIGAASFRRATVPRTGGNGGEVTAVSWPTELSGRLELRARTAWLAAGTIALILALGTLRVTGGSSDAVRVLQVALVVVYTVLVWTDLRAALAILMLEIVLGGASGHWTT